MNSLFLALSMPGGPEVIFIFLIILVLFGAKKLPELARGLGRSVGEFRKAQEEVNREIQQVTSTPLPPANPVIEAPKGERQPHQPV